MKKTLCLFLALIIIFGMTACNSESGEKQPEISIVGEWMAPSMNAAATFNEDGTGELTLNGTFPATWSTDTKNGKYIVNAGQSYTVSCGMDYDMPCLNIGGVDFYRMDDYGKAFTLLISRRCEDILNLSMDKTVVKNDQAYDIVNGVNIQFLSITASRTEEDDGIEIEYLITNERTEPVTEPLALKLNARYYLDETPDVIERTEEILLSETVDAGSGYFGTFRFSFKAKTEDTIKKFGAFTGGLSFEMYGQQYFIDLGVLFKYSK